jgi:two-component system, chemotaxis family, sensor kinase CheA
MDDILRDFVIETSEAIDIVDSELVRFEQEPNNAAILAQIFRLVHTVKGTCGFLNLPRLEGLAHAAETVIGQFRDGVKVTTEAVSLILETVDRIKLIIMELEANGEEPSADAHGGDGELINALENMARAHASQKIALFDTPDHTTGSMVYQVLERQLRPGEVSLDDLEAAFRNTDIEPASHHMQGSFNKAATAKAPYIATPRKFRDSAFNETEVESFKQAFMDGKKTPDADAEDVHEYHLEAEKVEKNNDNGRRKSDIEANANTETVASKQTLRVDIHIIDHLMTMVSELVLTRNQLLEIARKSNEEQFKVPLQRLSSITAELQETVMKTRMQPIAAAWAKLPRVVRDLSIELNKQIELETHGAETEIDRHVLDLIRDPLVHMIRNAADHGLETTEERIACGKPRTGIIRLSALQEGGYIVLEVSDDGRGLNLEAVAKRAVSTGLATPEQIKRMSESELARFIFNPGFSTASAVTSVSGRGVGMDVVLTNIEQAGGVIDVRTTKGQGTVVYIKIPVTLAIANALIIETSGQRFAIPQMSVVELVRAGPGTDIAIEMVNEAPVMRLRNELLPIANLSTVLKIKNGNVSLLAKMFVVICQVAERRFGLIVDGIVQTEEIVVKSTSAMLRSLQIYSGVTILGDGSVVMILDPAGIGRSIGVFAERRQDKIDTQKSAPSQIDPLTSLLVFRFGEQNYRAVPLELITRLEEIDGSQIEVSGGQSIIQYRGKLMPLIAANGNQLIAQQGSHNVLVFSCGMRIAGLVVDQIVDIVEDKLDISASSQMPGVLGSAIIGGRATDIIDIAHYLPFEMDGSDKIEASQSQPTVLIVDGSGFFRAMLAPVIKAAGYKVAIASDASSAMREMQNCSANAVLIDLETPSVAGFDLASLISAANFEHGVHMIGLANRAGNQMIAKARMAGFVDLVGKFDRQGLIASLNELFNLKNEAA